MKNQKNIFIIILLILAIIFVIFLYKNNPDKNNNDYQIRKTLTKLENENKELKDKITHLEEKDRATEENISSSSQKEDKQAITSETEDQNTQETMTVMIPKLEWNDTVGEFVVNYHQATVPKSPAVLNAVYKKLFDENEYNGTYEGTHFKSVSIINGVAQVYLTGTWYPTGDMSKLYFTRNIEAAAFQYPNVKEVQVYLNGEPFDWCIDDESDGENGCPETQYLWNVTRDEYESY